MDIIGLKTEEEGEKERNTVGGKVEIRNRKRKCKDEKKDIALRER